MAMFDPKKQREEGNNRGIPGGDYYLAIKNFKLKTSKAGKPYMNACIVVIDGAAKKRTFFDFISLDTSNDGAMARLGMLAELCGVEQAFDTEDERALREHLVMRPFKAAVVRKVENGYVNNSISRYVPASKLTDQDRDVMDTWAHEAAEDATWNNTGGGGDYQDDVPPPNDDDFHGGAPTGRTRQEDDIPF